VRNPNTFLYNTGPITSLTDTTFNVRQFYTVTRFDGPRRRGPGTVLATDLPTPPVNVGFRSTPDYEALAAAAVQPLPNGAQVFAGQRDDPFFVDLNVFDLLAVPPADTKNFDGLAGFNVHSIAIEVPISSLTANGARPSSASDPNAVIGVWSTASRPSVTSRGGGQERFSANYVQVSRLGHPLVNEVVIPRGVKDTFNALEPTADAAALKYVTDPELPKLLLALFNIQSPPTPRNDLDLPDRHSEPQSTAGQHAVGNAAPSMSRSRPRRIHIRSVCSAETSAASPTVVGSRMTSSTSSCAQWQVRRR
jgi:uncharacterized protein DUF4331